MVYNPYPIYAPDLILDSPVTHHIYNLIIANCKHQKFSGTSNSALVVIGGFGNIITIYGEKVDDILTALKFADKSYWLYMASYADSMCRRFGTETLSMVFSGDAEEVIYLNEEYKASFDDYYAVKAKEEVEYIQNWRPSEMYQYDINKTVKGINGYSKEKVTNLMDVLSAIKTEGSVGSEWPITLDYRLSMTQAEGSFLSDTNLLSYGIKSAYCKSVVELGHIIMNFEDHGFTNVYDLITLIALRNDILDNRIIIG